MEVVRQSEAHWSGDLTHGSGEIELGSGAFKGPYSFKERTADHSALTNPEELIAGAHAGCFSMALSAALTQAGFAPQSIHTTARVHLSRDSTGFAISQIDLATEAKVPNIAAPEFLKLAENAKKTCPVSKALAAVDIRGTFTLI